MAAVSSFMVLPLTAAPEKSTPGTAVREFFTAMTGTDFAKAKKLVVDKELADMIGMLESLAKDDPALKAETAAEFRNLAQGKIVSEKITGDTAQVVLEYQKNGKTVKETYNLKKISGQWKISH